jgi:hypothetical protein
MAGFWKSVFSEADGTGSASRITMVTFAVAALGWVTHVVAKTHQIPADQLPHIAEFVASPYAVNKASILMNNGVSAIRGNPPQQ